MITKKSKKTLAMAAAAAAVTGGTMAVTGNVHADTVNTQADTQTQTQNPQASDLKTQQDASRQAYADANKANADAHQATQNAQDNLVHATAKSTEAQGAVDNAQSAVNQASNDVTAATNKVNQAQTDVENAQDAQTQAQNDYDNAVKQSTTSADEQVALDQAQADAKTAEGAVTDAQSKLADATSKQSQAQSNADTATQNVKDANAQVKKAQSEVNNAQAAVNNAQNDVKNAQNHDQIVSQDESEVKAKTNAKNAADAKVNDAQKFNDERTNAKNDAQTAVNNAQKTVDQLNKGGETPEAVIEEIKLTPKWINYIKTNKNLIEQDKNLGDVPHSGNTKSVWESLKELGENVKKNNNYVHNPDLKKQTIEFTKEGSLTEKEELAVTRYAVKLINSIRQQIGTPLLQISSDVLRNATKATNEYVTDKYNSGHDEKALADNDVTESLSIGYFSDYRDWGSEYSANMDMLYGAVYDSIIDWVFNDWGFGSDWGHMTHVAGLRGNDTPTIAAIQANINTYHDGMIHFCTDLGSGNRTSEHSLGLDDKSVGTDDSNRIAISDEYDQGKINEACDRMRDALRQRDSVKKEIEDENKGLITISQEKKDAQNRKLSEANQLLQEALNNLNNVYFAKTNTKDDHAAQLVSAKQALQDAQAKLETAKQEASQASADLDSAKADAQHAADELKAAQDKLAHDQGSSMSLADAQAKLKNAKAVLAQKQANLADAKKNLQNANTMKSQSDSALEKANADVKDAQDAVQTAQAKAKDANAKVDAIKAKIAADNNSKALSDAEAKLNQTKQDLQVAQSKKDEADKALAKAQATLKNKQDALKKAQANAQNAAQNLKSAQDAVKKAQAHEQDTQAALKLAKDNLITDSKVYGNSVAIKDQTIHAGEINKIVDPEIANPMTADPTQSLVMGAFLQMAASKLDTIPTGTTASWGDLNTLNHDANTVGDHSEDVLVTFPDGSTTTVKMNLHVLVAVKPSQPDTPVVNPGHETKPGDDNKPSNNPSTTPSHEEQQPGTHTDTPTAKPSDQHPSTQPSGDQDQTTPDHKATSNSDSDVTVAPIADNKADGAQTVATNGNNNVTVKPVANEIGNSDEYLTVEPTTNSTAVKRSELNNGQLPQTGSKSETGLISLGLTTMFAMLGLASLRRKN
ncbi:SEC10/PgrA surface exclusion domain-containing protein [Limosilactobacillus reuteri]|uniref:SEC10/PgrA surface exclusion domain-containing protein n=1 Tax=Limosilactobacillus reuteri TaxID=1598 RepID=UPI003D99379D